MDSVWQLSMNRWQKVLRMKRVWWNYCIEMDTGVSSSTPPELPGCTGTRN
jgi:hypothetical protein